MARAGNNHKGGRPKGKKAPKTLERERVLEALRQRTMRIADRIFDKQLVLVNGQQFLYKIEKEFVRTGKSKDGNPTGYYRALKPELVEDELVIRGYLENLVYRANGDMEDEKDPGATYYFITTKEPSNQAIDSMLDRTFGRAVQATKLVGDDGKAAPVLIQISEAISAKNNLNDSARNSK